MIFNIYLASQSPRRRELLQQMGVQYQVLTVDVVEQKNTGESPKEYVCRLAKDKSEAGFDLKQDKPVLGADTIVVLGDKVLEKPQSKEEGVAMLLALSGNTHQVMTAVHLSFSEIFSMGANAGKNTGKTNYQSTLSVSDVSFREITTDEAIAYWNSGEPADKAGGYGIQGLGGIFVRELKGSYTGVVGLPLFETQQLLRNIGITVL